jgi:[ribosomal protein S5]-alanine N-acetyltransferase
MSGTRLVAIEDAAVLAELTRASRGFLAPWEPIRGEEDFTPAGQRAIIETSLHRYEQGTMLPRVILDDTGQVAGRINLNNIVRGALQSADLGYWVAEALGRRGLATAAVRDIIPVAFGELQLHRIQAATLRHNTASQRVLARNGFTRIGVAAAYLKIAGQWQDHILYQLINPEAAG